MGTPSADKPWGWQMDGHHLIINYFVLGDQVVMSPVFVGSEPVIARSGKYEGVAILQDEQARGLAMLRSLSAAQRKQAVLESSKTVNNNLTEAFKDNVVLDYAGIQGTALDVRQRENLIALVELFVANLSEGHAKVRMDEVRTHLDRTYFAWIGGDGDASVFYFRIHSPVILVEFDHQRPANTRHLVKDAQLPIRDHIHVVVRTPNGNDYGKDLLRQHYERHRH
jgi:predicted nuclease of restriction endonuclease-like (RecB) superfamily